MGGSVSVTIVRKGSVLNGLIIRADGRVCERFNVLFDAFPDGQEARLVRTVLMLGLDAFERCMAAVPPADAGVSPVGSEKETSVV